MENSLSRVLIYTFPSKLFPCLKCIKMGFKAYDEFADLYDKWFLKNENVLFSEAKLVAHCLKDAGRVLSVGCGSGLFEMLLDKNFDIHITDGVEPAKSMAEIAQKRGIKVTVATAEEVDLGNEKFDTLLFNGCPCYINDLQKAFDNTTKYLKNGGKIVVIDVPKESAYAILYNLAKTVGSWDDPMLQGITPPNPYPIEFVAMANWRTTADKSECLTNAGFGDFNYFQTLTSLPFYSNNQEEEPSEGYDKGSYVAICGVKKNKEDE